VAEGKKKSSVSAMLFLKKNARFYSASHTNTSQKVIVASRWTALVNFIAADQIYLPNSTLHSIGSLYHCLKISRSNKRQSRFVKVGCIFLSIASATNIILSLSS
jgi:hypothetical protein